jgi:hypothetical protein
VIVHGSAKLISCGKALVHLWETSYDLITRVEVPELLRQRNLKPRMERGTDTNRLADRLLGFGRDARHTQDMTPCHFVKLTFVRCLVLPKRR